MGAPTWCRKFDSYGSPGIQPGVLCIQLERLSQVLRFGAPQVTKNPFAHPSMVSHILQKFDPRLIFPSTKGTDLLHSSNSEIVGLPTTSLD